jgi:two-component system sensor histidine kinase/response regulator
VALEGRNHDRLYLQFSVRDTGIGIPKEKQRLIFEAFSQADGSTTRRFGGTGLGLTISARLVEAMDGEIWVESAPGQGSSFCFTASFGVSTESSGIANLAGAVELAGARVLVVDDNETNRRILMGMLNAWGMKTVPAAGAAEALAKMRNAIEQSDPFRLVLTDVHMPGTDGFDLARRIQENPEMTNAVVMMLTSGEHGGDLARCRDMGVAAYLTKPVRRTELHEAIRTAIAAAKPHASSREISRTEDSVARGLRILLAEDNAVNQRVAMRILEKAGHHVQAASNGKVALQMLEQQSFDVVLMDVQMPEMDGFEATGQIRRKEQHTGEHMPIIAMTAHAMAGDRERCLEAGMDDYVTKPVSSAALLKMVAAMAALQRR